MHMKALSQRVAGALALCLTLSLPASAAVVETVTVSFGTKLAELSWNNYALVSSATPGGQLTLSLNDNDTITAVLTTTEYRLRMFGVDTLGQDSSQQILPSQVWPGTVSGWEGNFFTAWYTPTNDPFQSLTWTYAKPGGYGGSLANLANGTSSQNYDFMLVTQSEFGINTQWFAGPVVSSVPVPASAPLLLAGFGALALMRRRKRG